jgi:hypothetical protein
MLQFRRLLWVKMGRVVRLSSVNLCTVFPYVEPNSPVFPSVLFNPAIICSFSSSFLRTSTFSCVLCSDRTALLDKHSPIPKWLRKKNSSRHEFGAIQNCSESETKMWPSLVLIRLSMLASLLNSDLSKQKYRCQFFGTTVAVSRANSTISEGSLSEKASQS